MSSVSGAGGFRDEWMHNTKAQFGRKDEQHTEYNTDRAGLERRVRG